jgi:hypothetical protein
MPPFSWSAALAGRLLHREESEFAVAGKNQGENDRFGGVDSIRKAALPFILPVWSACYTK